MPVNTELLNQALAAIRKEYGNDSIGLGDDTPDVPRISTGDLMLDWATMGPAGQGGIPIGRWTHAYGGYSSAKTLTCGWNVIREAQKLGMLCVYYNVEKQFDPAWLRKQGGIDLKKLHVVEGSTIEGTGTVLESLLGVAHLHVIDSLAAAISVDELAEKAEDWRPGIQARAWGKVLKRANERFDPRENTIIMINQTRELFGRGGEAATSGRFVEYQSSLTLHFRRSSWLYRDKHGNLHDEGSNKETATGDTEPAGIEFQVRVAKSRVCPPHRTARMRLDFETGRFDQSWALTKMAKHLKIAERSGAWYSVPEFDIKVQGENALREAIKKNSELEARIREASQRA